MPPSPRPPGQGPPPRALKIAAPPHVGASSLAHASAAESVFSSPRRAGGDSSRGQSSPRVSAGPDSPRSPRYNIDRAACAHCGAVFFPAYSAGGVAHCGLDCRFVMIPFDNRRLLSQNRALNGPRMARGTPSSFLSLRIFFSIFSLKFKALLYAMRCSVKCALVMDWCCWC